MAITIKDKLFSEYPIPADISIWGGSAILPAVSSLEILLETSVSALQSDLFIVDYIQLTGMSTGVDSDVVAVVNARLDYGFQGNTSVQANLDLATHSILCRYYPAIATVRRLLRRSDLDSLCGSKLQYFMSYVLWRMSDKELTMLRSVVLDADNGAVNLDALASFSSDCRDRYEALRSEILIYSTGI